MSDNDFDPYRKWLGIAVCDQPPNYYRLLGLDKYENDSDVIDAAANRQMAYIQQKATGKHAALSQRILNEMSAARLCLLDPMQKTAYDAELRASSASKLTGTDLVVVKPPPRPLHVFEPALRPLPPVVFIPEYVDPQPRRRPPTHLLLTIFAGTAGLMVAIGLLVLLASSAGGHRTETSQSVAARSDADAPPAQSQRKATEPAKNQGLQSAPASSSDFVVEERSKGAGLYNSPSSSTTAGHSASTTMYQGAATPAATAAGNSAPERRTLSSTPSVTEGKADLIKAKERFTLTSMVGSQHYGTPFREQSPDESLLVGLEMTTGKFGVNYQYSAVGSIRCIYNSGNRLREGTVYGGATKNPTRFVAKPGYAIGGLRVNASGRVMGVQIRFMRVKDGVLDPSDSYFSSPYLNVPVDSQVIVAHKRCIGVGGVWAKEELRCLGLVAELNEATVVKERFALTPVVGTQHYGNPFREQSYDESPLVGLELTTGKFGAGYKYSAVGSIRCIYRSENTLREGAVYGGATKNPTRFVAKPGYAIGGLRVNANSRVYGVQIQFMRIKDGMLDPNDSYTSEPYLDVPPDSPLVSAGRRCIGVGGAWAVEELRCLGLVAEFEEPTVVDELQR